MLFTTIAGTTPSESESPMLLNRSVNHTSGSAAEDNLMDKEPLLGDEGADFSKVSGCALIVSCLCSTGHMAHDTLKGGPHLYRYSPGPCMHLLF